MTLAVPHGGTSSFGGTADGAADATAVAARGERTDRIDPLEWERTPVGIAVGLGAVAVITAALIAAAIPAAYSDWRFALMAAAVGLFAAISLDQVALAAVTGISALVANGFLENSAGQLVWHGSEDLWRLLLLVMIGAVGLAIGEAYRYLRKLRALWRVEVAVNRGHVMPEKEEEHGA